MFTFLSLKPPGCFFLGIFKLVSEAFLSESGVFSGFSSRGFEEWKALVPNFEPVTMLDLVCPITATTEITVQGGTEHENGCKNNASFLYPTPPNKKKKEGNDAAAFAPAKSLHLPEQTKPKRKDKGGRKPLGQTWTSFGGSEIKKSYQLQKIVHVQNQAVRIWCTANDL